ncbi:MAG: methyltransferase domain-containing protein [Moraxellaceae bacterium]|nr:methyltransferase domain-containing protein [Moraxellaceae bacterium]MDZ4387290.1 methyltransferase domain-containing protein [Moraxellaceae bacterium]
MTHLLDVLRCPVCSEPLSAQEDSTELPFWRNRVWACSNNHSFDVARQGYLNLLLVQQKKSLTPGDTALSVAARRAFLSAGHYQVLRDAFAEAVAALKPLRALDIGCGEGYYTQVLSPICASVAGIDIAKPAVFTAASSIKNVVWLVGSAIALPLEDASVNLVSSLFSPIPMDEINRVLASNGHLVLAIPAEDHLWSFREALFGEVKAHEPMAKLQTLDEQFELVQQQRISQDLTLDSTALIQLMDMTPYAWKAQPAKREALAQQTTLNTKASFVLSVYQKR